MPHKPPVDLFRNAARLSILRMRAQRRPRRPAGEPERPFNLIEAFSSMMAERRSIEALAVAYYRAREIFQEPPYIADGIVRDYAYVMGQTITWRDGAPTPEHRRGHQRAMNSFHDCIREQKTFRDAPDLAINLRMTEVTEAVHVLSPERQWAVMRWYCRAPGSGRSFG